MKTEGRYVEYRGATYTEGFYGKDWIAVYVGDAAEDAFPDAIEVGEGTRGGRWAKLPKDVVARRWTETVHARWRGAEVTVGSHVSDTEVTLWFVGSPAVAAELGMEGSPYDTWHVVAPADEVEVVDVEVRELD